MKCTCPHHYTAVGLVKFGADALCPVHGAPKPNVPTNDDPKLVSAVCPRCALVHTGRFTCP